MSSLAELLTRVEGASGPDRELDGRVWCAANGFTYRGSCPELGAPPAGSAYVAYYDPVHGERPTAYCPALTGSLDATLALVERVLPGAWWILGKGRLRGAEPLYGAQLLFGSDEEIGAGEHEASPELALLAALLRALTENPPKRASS